MEWRHTVWDEPKLVYTSIPKVANTSIKTALLASYIPHVRRKSPHNEDMPYVDVKASQIRREHPDHCHFAVVRDPFDRLVSFWSDKIFGDNVGRRLERLGFDREMSFAEGARHVCGIDDRRADPHFRSQSALLVNRRGELGVDLALRFERLVEDWELLGWLVGRRTAAALRPLPRRRVSVRDHVGDYYPAEDDELVALVAQRYADDFALLGYPLDPRRPAVRDDARRRGAVGAALADLIAARPGASVLDLSAPSPERAQLVETAGGHYLGSAGKSPVGQLADLGALTEGRIDVDAFDVLLVDGDDLGFRSRLKRIRRQFRANDRTVLTETMNAARSSP